MNIETDFKNFALDKGASRSVLDDYLRYINQTNIYPGILEERTSAMRAVEMNVFSRLMYDRIIYFSGEVTQDTCDVVIAQLLYLSSVDDERDINMYINSPGGNIEFGLGVIDTMDFIANDVSTTCVGLAASMGAVLLSNGTKGKRSVLKHSRVMIHSAASSFHGHTEDIRIEAAQLERAQKDIYEILAKNCGKTYDEITNLCQRDNWFIGEEAVKELNIADKVLDKR